MRDSNLPLVRPATFWTAAGVLALVLWASNSPTVLYPHYADLWGLTEVVTTAIFGTYAVALLLILLLFGGLSDRIGRKRAMLFGVIAIVISGAVCAAAPDVTWLFVGRALQGIGTGLALSAASAAIVENNPSRNARWASIATTVSSCVGMVLGVMIGGAFLNFVPAPLMTNYLALIAACVPVLIAVVMIPRDSRGARTRGIASTLPRVPRRLFRVWLAAALSCGLAYGTGAVVMALGADMARQFTGIDDDLVVGTLMATSFLCVIAVSLCLGRVPARTNVILGILFTVVSAAFLLVSAGTSSMVAFVAWLITTAMVFAFGLTGGLALINRAAPEEHRAAALSLVFLVCYVFQLGASVGIGALATSSDLQTAVAISALGFGAICVFALIATLSVGQLRPSVTVLKVDAPEGPASA